MRCRVHVETTNKDCIDNSAASNKGKITRSDQGLKESYTIDESQILPIDKSNKNACNMYKQPSYVNQYALN